MFLVFQIYLGRRFSVKICKELFLFFKIYIKTLYQHFIKLTDFFKIYKA